MNARWPWRTRSRRRAAPGADLQDINALLDTVHQLRLTLTADLAAAASAIDADEPEVARDIVAADSDEVRRLADLPPRRVQPQPQPAHAPRRRALLALPAIPLAGALAMTGAAALTGGGGGGGPRIVSAPSHQVAAPTTHPTPPHIRRTAASTLHHLEQLVLRHPHGAEVVEVASSLHRQLTAILATSPNNAKRLGEVQHLLLVEQRLLETHHGQATAIALAASREITHLLKVHGLPTALPTLSPSSSPTPLSTPTTQSPTPEATKTNPTSPQPQPSTTAPANPFPSPRPAPSRTSHRPHHHHPHPQNPLFGPGFFNGSL